MRQSELFGILRRELKNVAEAVLADGTYEACSIDSRAKALTDRIITLLTGQEFIPRVPSRSASLTTIVTPLIRDMEDGI